MRQSQRTAVLIAFAAILVACSAESPAPSEAETHSINDHVTFYGVGKVARFQQHMDSSLEELGPVFFAEIFIAVGGEVTAARVRFPDRFREMRDLEYRYSESDEIGDVMYLSGITDSNEAMEAEYPTGAYEFSFSTPGGDVLNSVVSFEGGHFPTPPVIIFEQGGERIAFDAVDPARDLTITWPPFSEGDADPNGILDDLIFVAIDSCTVEDIVHSGRPFEKDNYLTFRAERYVVPAGTLLPGQTYSMYVEHALLPHTQQDYGMPAFATFAASTYMDFMTTGETDASYCGAQSN
ncbi:MAG: hypothetical protein OEM63_09465 [Gammaproteobacteria bacterium]|nr:hypothetical protein [Gammaproteobacteria bacterium]